LRNLLACPRLRCAHWPRVQHPFAITPASCPRRCHRGEEVSTGVATNRRGLRECRPCARGAVGVCDALRGRACNACVCAHDRQR
jgi:hypothetical protein